MIELLVIGATLSVAAWAYGAQAHRRSTASRALERYAESRHLHFVPALTRDASPVVVSAKNDVEVRIDLFKLGQQPRTRAWASPKLADPHGCGVMSVAERGAFSIPHPSRQKIGHPEFDDVYILANGDQEDVDRLHDTIPTLLLLQARGRRGVWLIRDSQRVALSWLGMESDPLILDAAREVVGAVAAWDRRSLPYR